MMLEDYNNFYHVDISTQIDNKWKDDTIFGIVKDSKKYSIKIRGRDKEKLKERFISGENSRSARKHNKRVVALIYSFLFYKALNDFQEANPLLLCRDVRPERIVLEYLQKICRFFNNKTILWRKIKFRKRVEFETQKKLPKSLAGKYVRKVYQGKLEPTRILNSEEIEELIEIISKRL